MRGWCGGGLIVLVCLVLAACAAQPAGVTPEQAVVLLRSGRPLLSCREDCVAEWRRAQPQAAQLDAAGRWTDLATLVESVNYQDDLSLYYLGRAAEGLGYPGAAASYYRQSTYLSGTSIACAYLSRQCGGVVLPRAAQLRLAAIDRELMRSRRRVIRPAARPPAAPPPEAVAPPPSEPGMPAAPDRAAPESEAPVPSEMPALAPDAGVPSAPSEAPPPPPPPGPPASEFIEPPPASR